MKHRLSKLAWKYVRGFLFHGLIEVRFLVGLFLAIWICACVDAFLVWVGISLPGVGLLAGPFVMAVALLAAGSPWLAEAWIKYRRNAERRRRLRLGLCITCEYDLTGNVSGVCPECGTKIEKPEPKP